MKLVNTIIANTKGDGEKSGEDFWVKSERLFYCALIGYIYYEAPEAEKNFTTLLENDKRQRSPRGRPRSFKARLTSCLNGWKKKTRNISLSGSIRNSCFRRAKTRSSILISCGARLAPFDIRELRELMETDEMELDTLGDRKTALFVIISDTDDTLILSYQSFTHSFSISFATRQMMCTGGRLPSMCAVC